MLNVGEIEFLEQEGENGQLVSGIRIVPEKEGNSNVTERDIPTDHPQLPVGAFRYRRGIIGDPTYFPSLVETKARIIRAICILPGPVPHTGGIDSLQIIIPQRELLRSSGIACP